MLKKMKLQAISLACAIAVCSLQPAFAQTGSGNGLITSFSAGWSSDTFTVTNSSPIINPAGCAATGEYIATSTAPGYNTYYAAVLTAYSTGSNVAFIISNTTCTQGFPTIIGVNVTPSSN